MEDIKPKVFAHGSYIGTGGYNNHTRDFFRHLSKIIKIKIRNFTIGGELKGMSDEPHNDESYINDVDKKLLIKQTLWNNNHNLRDWEMYSGYSNNFNHNVNLILSETNHHYYFSYQTKIRNLIQTVNGPWLF